MTEGMAPLDAGRLACRLALSAPSVFGGIVLRGRYHPGQAAFLAALRHQRIPPSVDEARLSGGLDLAATLAAGRPVHLSGLIATGDGPLVLPSAERASSPVIAALAAHLDDGGERPVIALDEADGDDPPLDRRLADRLAFIVTEAEADDRPLPDGWRDVEVPDAIVEALAGAALALGVPSLRSAVHAVAAARAIAALEGAAEATETDAGVAAALILAPRATRLPATEESASPPEPAEPPPEAEGETPLGEGASERIVEAAKVALPADLLAGVAMSGATPGRVGAKAAASRGRPGRVRRGLPGRGLRLALTETLTAAAPWRTVRGGDTSRIPVRRDDIRVRQLEGRSATLTVFCVDASGSQAYARMAEVKGAVERVLASAYARRDQVALVAFRGTGAEVLLPPTPSLTRAKRALAALPGGGGTPLAAGLGAALRLALAAERSGFAVTLLVLTDGRANVTLAGEGGRAEAAAEALALAQRIRAVGVRTVLIDTGRRPSAAARDLADALSARYVPLPAADSATLGGLAAAA